MSVVSGCPVPAQKSEVVPQTFRRRARLRAAAVRCRSPDGQAGVAVVCGPGLVAEHTGVDSADPSIEVTFTNPNVHTLSVQIVHRTLTPSRAGRFPRDETVVPPVDDHRTGNTR